MSEHTKEPQYQFLLELEKQGLESLGLMSSQVWRDDSRWNIGFQVHDMMAGPLAGDFDGVYAVEVIEHIPAEQEDRFVGNLAAILGRHGACLIGTPTLESQVYASPPSKAGHVNCKDAPGLRALMLRRFHQVFMFS